MYKYVKASRLPYTSMRKSPYFESTDFSSFENDDYNNIYEAKDIDNLLKFMKQIEYLDGAERVSCDLQFKTIYVGLDANAAQSTNASDLLEYEILERSHNFRIRCYAFDVEEYYGDGLMTFSFAI